MNHLFQVHHLHLQMIVHLINHPMKMKRDMKDQSMMIKGDIEIRKEIKTQEIIYNII